MATTPSSTPSETVLATARMLKNEIETKRNQAKHYAEVAKDYADQANAMEREFPAILEKLGVKAEDLED